MSSFDDKTKKSNKNSNKSLKICIVILILISFVLAALLINQVVKTSTQNGYFLDKNAQDGRIEKEEPLKELQKQLQDAALASTFTIQIHSSPKFDTWEAEGGMYIGNEITNDCLLTVTIYLDKNGEEIYKSPVLKPGDKIDKAKLQKKLLPGEYPATAIFTATTLDGKMTVGEAAAGLKITIGNGSGS